MTAPAREQIVSLASSSCRRPRCPSSEAPEPRRHACSWRQDGMEMLPNRTKTVRVGVLDVSNRTKEKLVCRYTSSPAPQKKAAVTALVVPGPRSGTAWTRVVGGIRSRSVAPLSRAHQPTTAAAASLQQTPRRRSAAHPAEERHPAVTAAPTPRAHTWGARRK